MYTPKKQNSSAKSMSEYESDFYDEYEEDEEEDVVENEDYDSYE